MTKTNDIENVLGFAFGVPFTIIGFMPELLGIHGALQFVLLGMGILMLCSVAFGQNAKTS